MNLMGKLFKRDSEKPAERKPADIQGKVNTNPKTGAILSGEQKQRIVKQKLKEKKNSNIPKTCQDTIVYKEIYKDGICRVTDTLYNKTLRFGDINYQLAQNEDKTAAFESWCDFYNYFDSSIFLQISCVSHYANAAEREKQIDIPLQGDEFDAIRDEYVTVLKTQLSKGNKEISKEHPESCQFKDKDSYGFGWYYIDKHLISIRKPWSNEAKQKARDRMLESGATPPRKNRNGN